MKLHKITKKLTKLNNILAVYIFGSASRGNMGKLSDLDIGIVLENSVNILNNAEKSLKLYEKLFDIFANLTDNSNKLDIVFLQRTPLSLQKEAVTEGKLIYHKNIHKVLEYKESVLNAYLDFKPIIKYFHQKIIERNLYGEDKLKISD
jgi:uncharacterized protein